MKSVMVSEHTKRSIENEKNWGTISTECDRRGGCWSGRDGRQSDYRRKDVNRDEKKVDTLR